ncbi:hypothetical protein POTOM_037448 [Populus tomentosa]|uniref:Uncharacterized protein n=1 Tax=Populus tomentosa TaxID=118781 RepID=A0A8X8CCK4_POPTO|nr:hypothetical protein POTOM_037448 [Populus tomentosa]
MVSCSHKTCCAFLPGFCLPFPLQYWIATDGGKKSYTVEAKTSSIHDAATKRKYLSADAQDALVDGVRALECVSVKCMVFILLRGSLANGEILLV